MQLFLSSNLGSFSLSDDWANNFSSKNLEFVLYLPPNNVIVEEKSVESEHLGKVVEHWQVGEVFDTLVFSLLEGFC